MDGLSNCRAGDLYALMKVKCYRLALKLVISCYCRFDYGFKCAFQRGRTETSSLFDTCPPTGKFDCRLGPK